MKTIKNINTFAIGLPFAIAITYPIFTEGALFFAALSTMITGFLQLSIGVKLLIDNPQNRNLQIYISGVVFFFGLWLVNYLIDYNDLITYILFPIPFILAVYLSLLIYQKK
jgi:apolipoprotein N-acyltransferase